MKKISTYCLILGVGLIVLVLGSGLFKQKQTIGMIDTHALIAIEAAKVAKTYPKGNVPQEALQKIAEKIKNSVDDFAKEEGFILLTKGAVWGGELPDFTDQMIERLKKE